MFDRRHAIALCFGAATLATSALADGHIAGLYTVEGRNPDGSSYGGNVSIGILGADQYVLNWDVGSSYEGTGTLSGDVLTVEGDFSDPVFYLVMPDGELHGTWADGRGLERLEPMN
jgi:hypothetical protein